MAPTAVLFKLTSTTTAMNTTTTNNISVYIAHTSAVISVCFRAYQDTVVGYNFLIRTIVPPGISAKPHRKTTIDIPFFRHIISLSSSPSVTMSDLTATVEAYFRIPTSSAERVAGRIVNSVRHAFFDIGNLQGIGFLASSGATIMVLDNHAANISFLTFHYIAFYVIIHLIYIYNTFPFVVLFTPV